VAKGNPRWGANARCSGTLPTSHMHSSSIGQVTDCGLQILAREIRGAIVLVSGTLWGHFHALTRGHAVSLGLTKRRGTCADSPRRDAGFSTQTHSR
jgi:hypothetical protein